MKIKIEIPIRPYLKKFLAKTNDIDPFEISLGSKCYVSSILLQKMEVSSLPDVKEMSGQSEILSILIPEAVISSKKFSITKESLIHFDNNLRSLFSDQLKAYVDLHQDSRGDIFRHIDKFMDYYNITEDDCKFETLVKKYYRARMPQDPRKNKNETVPHYIPSLFQSGI